MKFHKLFAVAIFVIITKIATASAPSLSINPADYSYTQSVTAVLLENCQELKNPNNMLIAYVNGQLRGYVNSSTVVGSRFMAFLSIYSNVPSGDTVKFKIYNADSDQLIEVKTYLIFKDDAVVGSPSVPIEMHTNNRPSHLQLSTLLIPETYTGDPSISTISAIDLDISNTLTYSLVAGLNSTDNDKFKVVGDQLHYNGVVNTGLKDTFKIRLNVSDNFGCTLEKDFALVIDKINDAPTGIHLSDSTFNENEKNPVIGHFTTVDPDLVDKFTYSFVAGSGDTDNANFSILDSTIVFNGSANYEVKNKYSVRIKVTDIGNLTYEKVFNFFVQDINDNPTNIILSTNKVFENEPLNVFVAALSTVDEDVNDRYTYTFANIGTNDNAHFQISNDTLKANKVFDFETKAVYNIYITSTDSLGLLVTKPYSIYIQDTSDAPTDINLDNNIITENLPAKTFIGLLSTVDGNKPPVQYTYTTVVGIGSNDNASFVISHDSLYANEMFDYETKTSYSIRVRTTLQNNMYTEKSFAISIKDVVSTNITLNNQKVYENASATQFVAKISTVSLDNTDQYTYSFGNIGTNDNTTFSISNDSIFSKKVFDYELKDSYVIYVTSTSKSGLSITRPFTIAILDSLDIPTDITLGNNIITENLAKRTFIGVFNTIDANKPPVAYAYTLVAGVGSDDNASFIVSQDSLYANEMFDYETKTTYSIRVRSTLINNMYTEKSFVISIKDQNEKPYLLSISKDSVVENTTDSTLIGYFTTSDVDRNDKFTYSFVGSDPDHYNFAIKGNSLVLVKTLNYEDKNVYDLTIRTTDVGGLTLDSVIVIHVRDLNEKPILINQTYEISELSAKDSPIGTVNYTDQDLNQQYSFSLGDTTLPFSIDNSGQLTLTGLIDYERNPSYEVWVKITDDGNPNMSDSIKIVIKISDEIELSELPSANLVSPNDDGYNDYWKITNVHLYKDYALDIVDEYGQSVYSVANNYNNDWDAKIKGEALPSGLYYYVFKSNLDGKLFKGNITVIK